MSRANGCRLVTAMTAVLAAAGAAAAQQPGRLGVQPVPVAAAPILNYQVLSQITPIPTRLVPGTYVPPSYIPNPTNPWGGPIMVPGYVTPPAVVQQLPGQYIRLPNGQQYNPWIGTTYNPYSNQFQGPAGVFRYDAWSGVYRNPWTGATYDPSTGTLVRPAGFGGRATPVLLP